MGDEPIKNEEQIEKYGNINQVMGNEGDGYYFWGYESESTFDFDLELKEAFKAAAAATNEFKNLVEQKITENGGDPEDWVM